MVDTLVGNFFGGQSYVFGLVWGQLSSEGGIGKLTPPLWVGWVKTRWRTVLVV